jgi:CDP-2,3-bis-(O-geranylgeranyl)-sn-glycerol synthase
MMLSDIIIAFWFFIPAGLANVAPIFAAKVPWLSKFTAPIDGGRNFRGQRLFGANKTWRGLVAGIITATIAFWFQQLVVAHVSWLHTLMSHVDYAHLPTLILGPVFAVGALGGDMVESFFKRRLKIPSGHSWFPLDQVDYIIGGAIVVAPFVVLSIWQYIWLIVVWLIIHLISAYIGWLLGLKDRPI